MAFSNRQIGPIGTTSRIAGGLLAIALPVALEGITWWDVGAAVIVLPVIAAATFELVRAAYRRLEPGAAARDGAIFSGLTCLTIAIIVASYVGLTLVTPLNGDVALWSWLGISLLVAAARGYGGCEVLAVPNLITGRRDEIGCILYTPIDRAEARRQASTVNA